MINRLKLTCFGEGAPLERGLPAPPLMALGCSREWSGEMEFFKARAAQIVQAFVQSGNSDQSIANQIAYTEGEQDWLSMYQGDAFQNIRQKTIYLEISGRCLGGLFEDAAGAGGWKLGFFMTLVQNFR